MTSWLEKGRPAIFEALAAACDRIDVDIKEGTVIPLPKGW